MSLMKISAMHYIIRDTFKNKWRCVLSVSGITLALVIFMSGYVFMDSYYKSQFNAIKHYNDNDLIQIKVESHDATSTPISSFVDYINQSVGDNYLMMAKHKSIGLTEGFEKDGISIKLFLDIYKTNHNFDGTVVVGNYKYCKKTELIEGRGFTRSDVDNASKVIIIDSIAAQLLFKGDAIGKTINVPILANVSEDSWSSHIRVIGYEKYEVIGVFLSDTAEYKKVTDEISTANYGEVVHYDVQCYIPTTCDNEKSSDKMDILYINTDGNINKKILADVYGVALSEGLGYECNTYESLKSEIESEVAYIKTIFGIVVAVLLVICILFINQIMIFSIKDNLSEYGIKKALGASDFRISIGVVAEMLIYSIIAFIFATILTLLVTLVGINVFSTISEISISEYVFSAKTLLLSGLIAVTTGTVSSVLPIIYISRKSIVEIIKFE